MTRGRSASSARAGQRAVGVRERHHGTDRAGTGHQDIRLRHRVGELASRSTARASTPLAVAVVRETLSHAPGAVTTTMRPIPARDQVRDRQAAHGAGTDHDGGPAGEIRRSTRRLRGGTVERHGHHRGARRVDAGLRMHPLADAQRLLSEFVQDASNRLLRVGRRVGRADLAEDLLLADHHRIETAGHREQMLGRGLAVAHVGVLGQVGEIESGMLGEQFADLGQSAVECVDDRVDLHPIAGGDDHRLRDVLDDSSLSISFGRSVSVIATRSSTGDRGRFGARSPPAEHSLRNHRSVSLVAATRVSRCTDADCGGAARRSDHRLRALLNDSICISTARSTRRTST